MLKNRIFLLLIANVLLGLFIFLDIEKEETPSSEIRTRIAEITSVIDEIEIFQPAISQRINFVKDLNEWKIIHPISWSIEPIALANLISKLSHLNPVYICGIDELDRRGEILEDYGFDENSSSFHLSSENSKMKITLGSLTRDENGRYLLIADEKSASIWRGPNQIEQLISVPINEWAQLTFIDFPIYAIDELEVKTFREGSAPVSTLLSKKQEQWSFLSPFQGPANENAVASLLHKLVSENLAGFAKPGLDLNLTTEFELNIQALGEMFTFELLKLDQPQVGNYLVKSNRHEQSFYIEDSFADILLNLGVELREKRLFASDLNSVRRIKMVEGNCTLSLRSTEQNSWMGLENNGEESISFTADSGLVRDLIHRLNSVEASSFVSFNPSPESLTEQGFDHPTYRLEVDFDDSTHKTILASKLNSETSLWNTYVSEHAFVCLVENQWDTIITTKAVYFKNRRLLPVEYQPEQISIKSLKEESVLYTYSFASDGEAFQRLTDFQADSFVDLSYNDEGIWSNGDWLPWKYSLRFDSADTNDFQAIEFKLTDRVGGTKWFAGSEELGVVANLPITIIDELAKGISSQNPEP